MTTKERVEHFRARELRRLKGISDYYEYDVDKEENLDGAYATDILQFLYKLPEEITTQDVKTFLGEENKIHSLYLNKTKKYKATKENLIHLAHCYTCKNFVPSWPYTNCNGCEHNILIREYKENAI